MTKMRDELSSLENADANLFTQQPRVLRSRSRPRRAAVDRQRRAPARAETARAGSHRRARESAGAKKARRTGMSPRKTISALLAGAAAPAECKAARAAWV